MSAAWRRRFKLVGAALLMTASVLLTVLVGVLRFAAEVLSAFASSGKRGPFSSSSSDSSGGGGE
ncbi:hypothetical protein OHS59_21510 [Streptomyces sp. NBC_00414]|uniref:hypothetical protein n=1 Tax=Streptomyces sp. NBC_00414 TaxID=2975739 RepID=UPI002E1C5802